MGKSYANWTFKKLVVPYLKRDVTLTTFEELLRWISIMLSTMTQAFMFKTQHYLRCIQCRNVYAKGLLDYLVEAEINSRFDKSRPCKSEPRVVFLKTPNPLIHIRRAMCLNLTSNLLAANL